MTDTRLIKDQIAAVVGQLDKAMLQMDSDDGLSLLHCRKAREIIEEIEREIYWSKRRSGEGR